MHRTLRAGYLEKEWDCAKQWQGCNVQEEAPRPRFVKPEAASAAKPGTAVGLAEDKTCSRPSLALPKV